MSVRELHNNNVGETDNGGLKEAINEDDNIIISDSTIRSLFPPKFENRQDTRSCVVVNFAYIPKIYINHYCHGEIVILKN